MLRTLRSCAVVLLALALVPACGEQRQPSTPEQPAQLRAPLATEVACAPGAEPLATRLAPLAGSAVCGREVSVSALLTDASGHPLSSREVRFGLAGEVLPVLTDERGLALGVLPAPATAGAFPVSLSFAGDDTHQPATASTTVTVARGETLLRLTGATLLASGGPSPLVARLVDAAGIPVPARTLTFTAGTFRATAKTDTQGQAQVLLPADGATGPLAVEVAFAGDECLLPARDTASVLRYLPTGFALWGGNTPGLQVGQRVNFWGHSWAKQVMGGEYDAQADFKGWSGVAALALCQPDARISGAPLLAPGCWDSKTGNSFPPASLPEYIGVAVTSAVAKQKGVVFGNVAGLAVVRVDREPAYGPVPGKPGWGELVAVVAPGTALPAPVVLSAVQRQPRTVAPGETFDVVVEVANTSSTEARDVRVSERFTGGTPAEAEQAVGVLAGGAQQRLTFAQTAPALAPRGAEESEDAYLARLAQAERLELPARGTVRYTDPTGVPALPLDVASVSRLKLPILTFALSAPSCAAACSLVQYRVTAQNLGSGKAKTATVTLTLPDGTQQTLELGPIDEGESAEGTVEWELPALSPQSGVESAAGYLARLEAASGILHDASATLVWTDARDNAYGALHRGVSTETRFPILTVRPEAPPRVLPGEQYVASFTLSNIGSARVEDAHLAVEGAEPLPPISLEAGQTAVVPVTLVAPLLEPRSPGESDADYLARLASADGALLTAGFTLEWTAGCTTFGPLAGTIATTRILPQLALALDGAAEVEAGGSAPYTAHLRNTGRAEAGTLQLTANLPDGTVRSLEVPVPVLARGASVAVPFSFDVPVTQAPGPLLVMVTASWRDARGNAYGPLSESVVTVVTRTNAPPVVDAGPDQQVTLPAGAALAGTASDDGMPAPLSHAWVMVSGPEQASLASAGALATSVAFTAPGTYVLRLVASDSEYAVSDELTVTVLPREGSGTSVGGGDPAPGEESINVVREGNVLRLDSTTRAFNFIWVANSSKGTVVKFDTTTGKILGEFPTAPNGQPKNPSRTTVDKNGNVWASNRDGNSLVHIGLEENGQCVDRNNNGVIDTSTGFKDVRAWGNAGGVDNNGGVSTATDECILHYVKVRSSGTRHVSVDENNDVWVSGTGGRHFDLVDGRTGAIKRKEGPVGYGGYGGLIDSNGVIWSTNPLLRWDTALPLSGQSGGTWRHLPYSSYGVCLAPDGAVWVTEYGWYIRKFAPDGTLLGTYNHGFGGAQGCVVDAKGHVWVAHSLGGNTVGHLLPNGTHVGNVRVGSGPTGVAVDGDGKVWATNHYSMTVSRIDPSLGGLGKDGKTPVGAVDFTSVNLEGYLYNYSDMTGSTLTGAPEMGTWSFVYDSGKPASAWGRVVWSGEVCGDASLTVSVASSENGTSFGTPVKVRSGQDFDVPNGRYLKVSVAFKRSSKGESPVLYDLAVGTADYVFEPQVNGAPSVQAGRSRTLTFPNATRLTGSVCDDGLPSGEALEVAWSQVSGPGTASFSEPQEEATEVSFSAPGTYVLRLSGSDGALEASSDVTLTVLPANQPPEVSAEAPEAVNLPGTAQVSGTMSDDGLPAGSVLSATWTKVSGPGTVTFGDLHALATTASFSAAGSYVLRLTASDGHLTRSADVGVVVNAPPPVNKAPVVSAGPNQTVALGSPATLTGSVTDDGLPAGKTVTRQWSKVSGPGTVSFSAPTSATTQASFSAAGAYVLRLTASDTEFTASSDVVVGVNTPPPTNAPPQVSPGPNLATTLPSGVQLLGSVSDDGLPAGATLSVTWTKTSGPGTVTFADASAPSTAATFGAAGTYVLRLSASDSYFTAWAEMAVVVSPAAPENRAPLVSVTGSRSITLPTRTASFAGSATDDGLPVGSALTYQWTVVSGPAGLTFSAPTQPSTGVTVRSEGEYRLRLAVSDSKLVGAVEVLLTVLPEGEANQPPDVDPGPSLTVMQPADAVALNGSVTDDGRPAGATVSSTWRKVSGPGTVTFADASKPTTTAAFGATGDYVLELSASDTEWRAFATMSVRVQPYVENQAPEVAVSGSLSSTQPGVAQLSGSVRDDGLPATGSLTLAWSKVSGPGTVTFSRPSQATTMASFSAPGDYVLRLTADDSALQASASVALTVSQWNQAPVVSAGPDRSLSLPTSTATLAGSVSDDGLPAGGTLRLAWTQVEGPAPVDLWPPSQPTPTASFPVAGRYVLRLTASDSQASSSDDVVITVSPASNLAPRVRVATSMTATMPGTVSLAADVSDDGMPTGVLGVSWSQVSGPGVVGFEDASRARTVASFPAPGTYVLRVTATDGQLAASADVVVSGRPGGANQPPSFDSVPPTSARTGELFVYAVLVTDVNGDAVDFSLPTAPAGMEVHPSSGLVTWRPTPAQVGAAQVVVRATDPAGLFTEQRFALEVVPGDVAPRFSSRPPLTAVAGTQYVYAAAALDPDDATLSWSVTGPAGMRVDAQGRVTWSVPADAQGSYPVTLTAQDAAGHTGVQSFAIGVAIPGDTRAPVVTLSSPVSGTSLGSRQELVGTVQDEDLAGYVVRACRVRLPDSCRVLAEGTKPVSAGKLAELDPMLLADGFYSVEVIASDAAGHSTARRVELTVATSGRKAPALRLRFPEFEIQTRTAALSVYRVFDGLDLTPGPLGRGWRYEWDTARISQPRDLNTGWVVEVDQSGFIPRQVVRSTVSHPIAVQLDDGRSYQFELYLEREEGLSSIHPVEPHAVELTGTGSTLTLLRPDLSPYQDFDLVVYGSEVYEWDFETLWRPRYARLQTQFGETIVFDADTGKMVAFSDGGEFKLELLPTGLRMNGTEVVRFEKGGDGMVSRATDMVSGARALYQRDALGRLVEVTTPEGVVQTFTYDDQGQMLTYETPGTSPERFEYDELGRVTFHATPSGSILRTRYDDGARTVTLIDAAGNTVESAYDAQGNVVAVTNPLGQTTHFAYKPGTSLETRRTDPLGNTWQADYDARGRRTVETNPLGETVSRTYDTRSSRILTVTDGEGRTFRETKDVNGRINGFVLPDGRVARTFSYPDENTIVSTDAQGRSTTTVYDQRGRVVSEKAPDGTLTRTLYDDVALTATVQLPDGRTTKTSFDRVGRATRRDLSGGESVQYVFDGAGQFPAAVLRPDGKKVEYRRGPSGEITGIVVDGQPAQQVRTDALGRIASVQRNGQVQSFKYDAAGRLTQEVSPAGTVDYTYDAAGRVVAETSSSGVSFQYTYDAAGRPITLENGAGQRFEVAYDKSGRITRVTSREGQTLQVTYDANGRRTGFIYPGGLSAQRTYALSDDLDETPPIESFKDIDGVTWHYAHDTKGQLEEIVDGTGARTRYARTPAGLVSEVTDALNRVSHFEWAPSGLARVETPEGRSQQYAYDAAGRMTHWTRADGTVVEYQHLVDRTVTRLPGGQVYEERTDPVAGMRMAQGAPGGDVTTWSDQAGRVSALSLGDGARVELSYTPEGELSASLATTPGGASFLTQYTYDGAGRVASVVGPDGKATTYGYDVHGRLVRITRPNGTETLYVYGELSRPTRIEHRAGAAVLAAYEYGYDTQGRVVRATSPEGTFEFGYDALSRLALERRFEGTDVVEEVHRVYDAVGNLVQRTDGRGTTTYAYDRDDRLLGSDGPDGRRTYVYSDRGALLRIEAREGQTLFAYDDLDRLTSVTLPSGEEVTYTYDVSGHLMARTDASGTRRCLPLPATPRGFDDCAVEYSPGVSEQPEARVFGAEGLAAVHGGGGVRHLLGGLQGNVVGVTDAQAQLRGSASYSPFGLRTSVGELPGYGFTGERQDPATGLVFLRSRWYHPGSGRFLTPDQYSAGSYDPRTLHRYAYAFSDPLNRTDPSGQFGLVSISISFSVSDALRGIETGIKHCLKEKMKMKIYKGVAVWAAKALLEPVLDSIFAGILGPLGGLLPDFTKEKGYHSTLRDILCNSGRDDVFSIGGFQFEVQVDKCGEVGGTRPGNNTPGRTHLGPAWSDCSGDLFTHDGLDIVFAGQLGIEVKLKAKTVDNEQVARYCRFGVRQNTYTLVYAFLDMPGEDVLNDMASVCWRCFQDKSPFTGKAGGNDYLGKCSNSPSVGSILFAFGIGSGKDGKKGLQFYSPDPDTLCGK